MFRRKSSGEDSPVTVGDLPHWTRNSGLNRHHSVEYSLTASLLYGDGDDDGGGREFVRVLDPEEADAYFVPFFSSLSFHTHGHNRTDPDTKIDHRLQVSPGTGECIHSYCCRFRPPTSNLKKDMVSPYVHVVDSFLDDYTTDPHGYRPLLLFFRGGTVRKDEGIICSKLVKILDGYDDVHYERSSPTTESIKMGMRSSKFCLHPAGDTPSSCSLFDAIGSHCVLIIVSNQIELPYEDEIDYTRFSIFLSVKEALQPGYMVDRLRQVSRERWVEMWNVLKNVSHLNEFQYPPKKEHAVDML